MEEHMRKRYGSKSFFTLFLISYLIILIIPAILAGGLYYQALKMTREKYIESEQAELSRAAAYFERYLEQLDSMSAKLVYDTDLRYIARMRKPEPGEKNVVQVVRFSERIKDMLSAEQYSDFMLMLRDNEFIFTNTSVVYGLEFFYDKSRIYQKMTLEEWTGKSFSASKRNFLPLQGVYWINENIHALTYNYPVRYRNDSPEAWAVVQYLIRQEELEQMFSDVFPNGQGQIRIYSEEGKIGSLGEDLGIAEETEFVQSSGRIEKDGIVTLYRKAEEGLIFAFSLPQKIAYQDAYRLGRIGFAAAFFCVLIEILLGCYFAWKYSKPLRNLLTNVRRLTGTPVQEKNEYSQLQTGVQLLVQANRDMQNILEDQRRQERRNVIDQILNGWFHSEKEIQDAADRVGLRLESGKYCVVLAEAGEELMQSEIRELPAEVHLEWVVDTEPGHYVMMACVSEEEELARLKEWLMGVHGCQAGIGRVYESLRDIPFSYQQAQYALKKEEGQILYYGELSGEKREAFFPSEFEEKLIQGVKHGEEDIVRSCFERLRKENLQQRTLSPVSLRILQAELTSVYMKLCRELALAQADPDPLMKEMTPAELMDRMEESFLILSQGLSHMQKNQKEDMRHKLLEYLAEHYGDQQMCVAMMAQEFGFSESYFSEFFREAVGEPFSGVLERIRLNAAKEKLKQGEDVESAATECGYSGSASFRRAFKRAFGVSPSVWRTENA